jgi:hypothetical protein
MSEKEGYWGAEREFLAKGGIVEIFNKINGSLVKKSSNSPLYQINSINAEAH